MLFINKTHSPSSFFIPKFSKRPLFLLFVILGYSLCPLPLSILSFEQKWFCHEASMPEHKKSPAEITHNLPQKLRIPQIKYYTLSHLITSTPVHYKCKRPCNKPPFLWLVSWYFLEALFDINKNCYSYCVLVCLL